LLRVDRVGDREQAVGRGQALLQLAQQQLLIERSCCLLQGLLRARQVFAVGVQQRLESPRRGGREVRERRRNRAVEDGGGVERVERLREQLEHQRRRGARRGWAVAHQVVGHQQGFRAQPAPLEERGDLRLQALLGRRQRGAARSQGR